jgi:5-methylcytosine-specific restriction endonuclease McrA
MTAFVCRTCDTTGEEHFYSKSKYYCKKCWNAKTYKSGIDKINDLKLEYGGKCQRCGYDKYLGALEFHHLDPTVKEYHLGQRRGLNKEALKQELDKCQLLCSNCHKEVHAGL